jgi:hypothetical protein
MSVSEKLYEISWFLFHFVVVGFPCSSTLSFYYKDYTLFENKFKQDGNVKILLGSLKKSFCIIKFF